MSHINIEIKAKCFHPEKVEAFLLSAGASFVGLDHQKDTYFTVPSGRLKLRQGNIENTLIFYNRPDQEGPKQSDFYLSKMTDGPATEQLLAKALGVKVIVEKYRKIFYINNVKFHLPLTAKKNVNTYVLYLCTFWNDGVKRPVVEHFQAQKASKSSA